MQNELEQLRAENERLKERQNKILRMFATTFPFEMKTPAYTIRGASELIKEEAENLTAQQLECLEYIQSANNHLFCTVDLMTDYARYGFEMSADLKIIRISEFESLVIEAVKKKLSEFGEGDIKFSSPYEVNLDEFRVRLSPASIGKALERLFVEIVSYRVAPKINLFIAVLNHSFQIKISAPNEIRDIPLHRTMCQNRYDVGYIDLAVEAIVELYGGEIKSDVVDEMIQINISFPLVRLDDADGN